MKIAYNIRCTLPNATLEQELELCQRAGFDSIELRIDKLRAYLQTHTRDELQSFFRKNTLRPYAMVGVHAYKGLFGIQDDAEANQKFMDDLHFGCEILCAVGAKNMIIVPPLYTEAEKQDYDEPWKIRKEENVRIFTVLSKLAKNYGVNLGIKIIDTPRCSVRTVTECNEIIDQIPEKNIGYTLDPFNFYLHGGNSNLESLKELYSDRIFVVHINGAEVGACRQEQRTFPDEGAMDVERYLEILSEKGYGGPVSLDISRLDLWKENPEKVICRAAESMRAVFCRNQLLQNKGE